MDTLRGIAVQALDRLADRLHYWSFILDGGRSGWIGRSLYEPPQDYAFRSGYRTGWKARDREG